MTRKQKRNHARIVFSGYVLSCILMFTWGYILGGIVICIG